MTQRKFKRESLHKDMKTKYAPTGKVKAVAHVANEFMQEILDLEPGSYVISDESRLRDFTDFGVSDTLPLWKRIAASYAIDQSAAGSERLVDVFLAIERRRHIQ